jgi:hypothetical protein
MRNYKGTERVQGINILVCCNPADNLRQFVQDIVWQLMTFSNHIFSRSWIPFFRTIAATSHLCNDELKRNRFHHRYEICCVVFEYSDEVAFANRWAPSIRDIAPPGGLQDGDI